MNEQGDTFALDWDIQKGSEVSTWIAIPKYKDGKMFETDTGKAEVTVDVSTEIDGNSYGKAQTVSMKIKDDRGVLDYLKHYWKADCAWPTAADFESADISHRLKSVFQER